MSAFDWIVVGAGPSGCAAAHFFAENSTATVLVLEKGPGYEEHQAVCDDLLYSAQARATSSITDNEKVSLGLFDDGEDTHIHEIRRGSIAGGHGAVNKGVFCPPTPGDLKKWPLEWSWTRVKADVDALKELFDPERVDDSKGLGKMRIGLFNAIASVENKGCHRDRTITLSDDWNNGQTIGIKELPLTMRARKRRRAESIAQMRGFSSQDIADTHVTATKRKTAYHTLLKPLLPENGGASQVVLKTNHRVMQVNFSGAGGLSERTAMGVDCIITTPAVSLGGSSLFSFRSRGNSAKKQLKQCFVARKGVLVCAGPIETPRLLMASGIGPKLQLEQMLWDASVPAVCGQPVVVNENVGKHMQHHYTVRTEFEFEYDVSEEEVFDPGAHPLVHICTPNPWDIETPGRYTTASIVDVRSNNGTRVYETRLARKKKNKLARIRDSMVRTVLPAYSALVFQSGPAYPALTGCVTYNGLELFSQDTYNSDTHELNLFTEAIDRTHAYMQSPVWANLFPLTTNKPHFHVVTASDVRRKSIAALKPLLETRGDFTSTCRMSSIQHPTEGVVQPSLAVRGVRKLSIAGSPVFPTITAGDPMVMSMVTGRWAARQMLANNQDKHQ